MPTPPANLPVADPIVSADDMQLQVDGQMVDWAAFWAQYDADYEVQPLLRAPCVVLRTGVPGDPASKVVGLFTCELQ